MSAELVPYTQETEGLGPAMLALAPRPRAFVHALITMGCSQAKAAEVAGYTGNAATLRASGHRLSADPRVQAAIQEESRKLIRSHGPMCIATLAEVAAGSWHETKDRIKAATALLDRGGLGPMSEHTVKVEHSVNDAQRIAHITDMAIRLGLDPEKLLGQAAGPIVDAEFTPVEEDPWTVHPEAADGPA